MPLIRLADHQQILADCLRAAHRIGIYDPRWETYHTSLANEASKPDITYEEATYHGHPYFPQPFSYLKVTVTTGLNKMVIPVRLEDREAMAEALAPVEGQMRDLRSDWEAHGSRLWEHVLGL